ncbi:SurA N-terminal domain-containing protein [Candidatus Contubernalis alkaliaceticus]|uniref:SurA N-terminal domain-containing protein n=1 Tax=Candidatus Contubernalis alkaliaceticus TaxID=338645 RepID=UPI001F4BE6E0|nr:SurA N-terminal domain-containing protein [Candidatus Contubernalis alkalaceticus]UNC92861.1 SurA N-terminal domain-containing protein [Candidatus Contubernalis alkalaceticus]
MMKNKKSTLNKVIYIVLALSLVLGLVLSAAYGLFDVIRDGRAAATSPDDVVALVNGEEIIRRDYTLQLEQTKASYEMQGIDLRSRESQELLQQLEYFVLEDLINQKLVIQKAREENMQVNQEEIQEEYEETVSLFENEEQLVSQLADMNLTLEDFKTLIEEQLLYYQYLEEYMERVDPKELEVSPEEIETLYSLYSSQYQDMPDYEEVQQELEEELRWQKHDEVVKLLMNKIREDSEIKILL